MLQKNLPERTTVTEYIIIILVTVMCFGYLGVFSRYRLLPTEIALLIIIIMLLFRGYPIRPISVSWLLLYIYILCSAIFLNWTNGYAYLEMLTVGILLFILKKSNLFYVKILNFFEIISVVFAIFTIINYFNSFIIINIFSFMLTSSQVGTILSNIANGGIPGVAGEVSYNAFCLSIGGCVAIGKLSSGKSKIKHGMVLMVLFIAILMTGKRSFILIMPTIVLMVYLLCSIFVLNKKRLLVLLIIIMVMPVIYFYGLSDVINGMLCEGNNSMQLSNREFFWGIALDMIKSKPLFGHGINSYDIYYNELVKRTRAFAGAHNSYLQVTAELGFAGALLYFFSIVVVAGKILKKIKSISKQSMYNEKTELLITSISIMILFLSYALSGNPLYQPQQLIAYFLFAGIGMSTKISNPEVSKLKKYSKKQHGNKLLIMTKGEIRQ